jgi:ParB family chromosome partitioning protein
MERDNLTQAQLAAAVSKGRSTIANSLRLLDLPEDAQQLLFEGSITAGHARAILSIPTEEGRALLTRKLVENVISVREAENLARLYAGRRAEAPKRVATPKSYKKVAKGLRDVLGTNVRVKTVGGKNKIEIEFKDEEELQELFKKMVEKD